MMSKEASFECPEVDKKITMKTTENPIVRTAPIGFSQKDSCSKRTWRATSGTSLTPRNEPLTGSSVVLKVAPPARRSPHGSRWRVVARPLR